MIFYKTAHNTVSEDTCFFGIIGRRGIIRGRNLQQRLFAELCHINFSHKHRLSCGLSSEFSDHLRTCHLFLSRPGLHDELWELSWVESKPGSGSELAKSRHLSGGLVA